MSEALGLRFRGPRPKPLDVLASPLTWTVVAALAAVAVLAAGRNDGGSALPQSFPPFYEAGQSAFATAAAGKELKSWSFAGGSPKTWTAVGRVFAPPAGEAASVRTGSQQSGYQLASPISRLPRGTYQVVVHGGVDLGGMAVSALDPDRETFLATSNYWSGQSRTAGGVMAAAFKLERPTKMRVILSNWAPQPFTSRWTIARVSISPLPAGAQIPRARDVQADYIPFYEAGAALLLPKASGPATAAWDFALQVPRGWQLIGSARAANRDGSYELLTTQSTSAYQLVGPPQRLAAGSYLALVDGRVAKGGMQVGVLDTLAGAWVGTATFWSGEQPGAGERIGLPFRLDEAKDVSVVLANWAPEPNSSSWSLTGVRIVPDRRARVDSLPVATPTAADRRFYAGEAQAFSPAPNAGEPLYRWSFAGGTIPDRWKLLPAARSSGLADGIVIRTSKGQFEDQLAIDQLQLPAGAYELVLDGRIPRGGLDVRVGALELTAHAGRAFFWSGRQRDDGVMVVPVEVAKPVTAIISIANRAPVARSSTWAIREIRLLRRSP